MGKTTAKSAKKYIARKASIKGEILYLCSCCAVIFLLVLSGINVDSFVSKDRVLGISDTSGEEGYLVLVEEKSYWQDFLKAHPRYLDGWVQLVDINLGLNDSPAASAAYRKAREIDPNSLKLGPYRAIFEE